MKKKDKPYYLLKIGKKVIFKKEFKGELFHKINIASTVEIIEEEAFSNCSALKQVYFKKGSKLKRIKEYAFLNCSSLEYIDFPSSLISIGFNAFGGCAFLKNVTYYNGAKYVGNDKNPYLMLYESCYEKEHISLNPKTKFILNSAFLDDHKIKSITFNKALTQIGEYAFDGCINLKSIRIKENNQLVEILDSAFDDCNKLVKLHIKKQTFSINLNNVISFILKNK